MPIYRCLFGLAGALSLSHVSAAAEDYLVRTEQELEAAIKSARPGDDIIMAARTWRDIEIVFETEGREGAPITLTAEEPGETVISGQSNLRLGGKHLVVSNLVFRDGHSPTDEVISFRRDSESFASHSKLSGVVIEGFNKADRSDQDHWVVLFGRNNVVERSAFLGKTNKGPTLVVRLNTPGADKNNHVIEGNYFGPRPALGGNGGETIRIGTSFTSRMPSQTVIRGNLFERCDGEVEIISIKSEENRITENLFYESKGSVVFRHGGNNTVSRNIFLGNGVEGTGGIRVINNDQTVAENYLEGLRGEKFLGALVIMNGVPNSPDNRYHQVDGARIVNNSFIDVARIGLGVGSDEERSAPPIRSAVTRNILTSRTQEPVRTYDDVSGISFDGNLTDHTAADPFASSSASPLGLTRGENGLFYPESGAEAGAPSDLVMVARAAVGPAYFEKPALEMAAVEGPVVPAEQGALAAALGDAPAGSIVTLAPGRHVINYPIEVSGRLTVKGPGDGVAILEGAGGLFDLAAGADLTLEDLTIYQSADGSSLRAIGETYRGSYQLHLKDVRAMGEGDGSGAPLLSGTSESFASSVVLENTAVENWRGSVLAMSGEGLDGWYLADRVEIIGGSFDDITGTLVTFGRDGRDESTYGPRFSMKKATLTQVGEDGEAIRLSGIDAVEMEANALTNSGETTIRRRVLGMPFALMGNKFNETPAPVLLGVDGEPMETAQ